MIGFFPPTMVYIPRPRPRRVVDLRKAVIRALEDTWFKGRAYNPKEAADQAGYRNERDWARALAGEIPMDCWRLVLFGPDFLLRFGANAVAELRAQRRNEVSDGRGDDGAGVGQFGDLAHVGRARPLRVGLRDRAADRTGTDD